MANRIVHCGGKRVRGSCGVCAHTHMRAHRYAMTCADKRWQRRRARSAGDDSSDDDDDVDVDVNHDDEEALPESALPPSVHASAAMWRDQFRQLRLERIPSATERDRDDARDVGDTFGGLNVSQLATIIRVRMLLVVC
jgi:hypothetical protein